MDDTRFCRPSDVGTNAEVASHLGTTVPTEAAKRAAECGEGR